MRPFLPTCARTLPAFFGCLIMSMVPPLWAADAAPDDLLVRPAPATPATPAASEVPLPPTETVPLGTHPLILPPVVRTDLWFVVEAPDQVSADRVLGMAQRMKEVTERYFAWPDHAPAPIEIHLVPAPPADFTGPFVVSVDHTGRYIALVRWGPDAKFSDTCLAIGAVTLKNIMIWKDGEAFGEKVPDWLGLALGRMLEASLKPPIAEFLAQQAAAMPVLSLRQITTAHGPFTEAEQQVLAVNAYWLARFLDQQCPKPALVTALFTTLAAGANPGTTITTAFPDNFDNVRDLELWWQVGYRDLMRTRVGPVESMAESRARLDLLEYVDLPVKDAAPKRIRLVDAWSGRTNQSMRDLLAAEVVTGPDMLLQINPVYHNAALSLLSAIGKLHGDVEKEFRDAWAKYRADRADAEVYQATVEAAMSEGN